MGRNKLLYKCEIMMNRPYSFAAILIFVTIFLLSGCVSKTKPEVTTQQIVLYNEVSNEADGLFDGVLQLMDILEVPAFQKMKKAKEYHGCL